MKKEIKAVLTETLDKIKTAETITASILNRLTDEEIDALITLMLLGVLDGLVASEARKRKTE